MHSIFIHKHKEETNEAYQTHKLEMLAQGASAIHMFDSYWHEFENVSDMKTKLIEEGYRIADLMYLEVSTFTVNEHIEAYKLNVPIEEISEDDLEWLTFIEPKLETSYNRKLVVKKQVYSGNQETYA